MVQYSLALLARNRKPQKSQFGHTIMRGEIIKILHEVVQLKWTVG